jgi:OOP family OmpA-OmpF porin
MTKRINILLAVLFVFAVTACGGPLKKNAMLIEAESVFARAKADPEVLKYAAEHLDEAEETLRKSAEARTDEKMSSLAYIGNNQVLTALEVKNFSLTENELARLRETSSQFALRTRERETQQALARKAQLEQQLAELQAEKTERGMVMTLGDVLFETGKAELMPGAVTMIRRLARFMQQYQDKRVLIEGHTDSTGSASFNLRLSEDRANAVQSLLLSEGISLNRIETIGYGMSKPVASNSTAEGRQRNRRVEIVIQ